MAKASMVAALCTLPLAHFSIAYAQDTVQTLLAKCNAPQESSDFAYCLGKVGGISDMMGINGLLIAKHFDGADSMMRFSTCGGKPTPTYGASLQAF